MNDKLLKRLVEATERGAKAQEELIELAKEERDSTQPILGPPICPHCGTFNPTIRSGGREGQGEMASFVLVAHCENCQGVFYALSQGWLTFTNQEQAQHAMEGRA